MNDNSTGGEVAQRELTFGERAVGLTFNPGNSPEVTAVKTAYAALIDQLNDMKPAYNGKPNEKSRMLAVAITELQTSQMWAVKAITWQYDR